MRDYKWFIVNVLLLLFVCESCYKRYFFEDRDDRGLSRFTNRGYNVASAYVNGKPWVTGFSEFNGPSPTEIFLDTNMVAKDTLNIRWSGDFDESPGTSSHISISLSVKKNFTATDFLAWNHKLFPADTIGVLISFAGRVDNSYVSGSGPGKIYFVNIAFNQDSLNSNRKIFKISGLFEGNIGSSVVISKGRFDYYVYDHNLP